jgi:hypothetical protein
MTPTPIVTKCASDPLVPLTVATYEPGGVDAVVDIVRVDVPVPPDARVILVELRVTTGPDGPIIACKLMVPANPFTLVKLTSEVADDPCIRLMLFGLAPITKSGVVLVVNIAVWMFSDTGVDVPLAMLTHVLGGALVGVQPVWNPKGIPVVELVMLYIAVKSRPDAPGGVTPPGIAPGAAMAAR